MTTVAIAIRNFFGFTGAVRTVQEHIRCLRGLGCAVDVIAENVDDQMATRMGAIPHKVGFWPLVGNRGRPYFNWRVNRLIKSNRFDLVFGHGDVVSQDVAFLHNCRHWSWELINGEELPPTDPVGKMHRRVLETGDFRLLMVYTHLMKDDICARFKVPEDKIVVFYPGINPDDFPVDPAARERVRKDLGVYNGEILVGLITSGCNKKRNIGLFLKAAGEVVASTNTKIKVLLLGRRASSKEHKTIAAEAGLTAISFIEPVVNVADYYQALDIYVLPAHLEEFGRVVLEAMAYGLPVVVSDRVGASEILERDGREGIFPASNQDLLVEKIRHLSLDEAYRRKLGRQNQRTAEKYNESDRMQVFLKTLITKGLITT